MSPEVYENLLAAIDIEVEKKGYKMVMISFFGGEPLLEYKAICNFMEKAQALAKSKGFQIHGWITTNAYTLSFEKLAKLVDLGVTHYQITVDGLRDSHDRNRFLVNGNGTWDVIIKNLIDAKNSDLDFKIVIRTNFDLSLAGDFENYISFISENFSKDYRFSLHFEAVKNLGIRPETELVTHNMDHDVTALMTKLAKKLGLSTNYTWAPFVGTCYASRTSSLVVDVNGGLLKCTTKIDSPENLVGELTKKGFEIDDLKICEWTSYDLPIECYDCSILPLCYGRKCPVVTRGSKIHNHDYCDTHVSIYESNLKTMFFGD